MNFILITLATLAVMLFVAVLFRAAGDVAAWLAMLTREDGDLE